MNTEIPLVSVMIPTYNQSEFLPVAVDSALMQTYRNLEILISDDHSPSASAQEVLKEYQGNPRVRVFRNETNLGRVANYQKTLYERARGEWVINLDGDDYFNDTTFIEQAMQFAVAHSKLVMISGVFVDLSPEGRLKPSTSNAGGERVYHPSEAYVSLLEGTYFPFHGSTLYKRQLAVNIGFYQHDIISADLESLLRLIQTGYVGSIPCEAMVRRRHGENVSCGISVSEFMDDTITFSAPLRAGVALTSLVDSDFLKEWVAQYTFRKGKDNAYKILKYNRSNSGYLKYVCEIVRCTPWSGVRIALQPKNILKMLGNIMPAIAGCKGQIGAVKNSR